MSSIDLIILGFLRKQPMSAYELVKKLESIRLQQWLKIGSPTIYQNTKKLAAKKMLSARTVREGEMPEKTIYQPTAAGEAYFLELMRRFAEQPGPIFFDFSAVVANLGQVGPEDRLKMLRALRDNFAGSLTGVRSDRAALPGVPREGRALMDLYESLFTVLIQWIEGLIEEERG